MKFRILGKMAENCSVEAFKFMDGLMYIIASRCYLFCSDSA